MRTRSPVRINVRTELGGRRSAYCRSRAPTGCAGGLHHLGAVREEPGASHRALAPIAPSVVISPSCFVISWARRRWPHGSTRRTGDPLGSRRKGLPPLDPSLQYKSEIHSPSNARRVKTTRSMPLRFGAPDRARDERHGWAVVRGTQSREKEMHVFPSGTPALGPRGHRTYQPHRGIALRSRRMRSRRLNG